MSSLLDASALAALQASHSVASPMTTIIISSPSSGASSIAVVAGIATCSSLLAAAIFNLALYFLLRDRLSTPRVATPTRLAQLDLAEVDETEAPAVEPFTTPISSPISPLRSTTPAPNNALGLTFSPAPQREFDERSTASYSTVYTAPSSPSSWYRSAPMSPVSAPAFSRASSYRSARSHYEPSTPLSRSSSIGSRSQPSRPRSDSKLIPDPTSPIAYIPMEMEKQPEVEGPQMYTSSRLSYRRHKDAGAVGARRRREEIVDLPPLYTDVAWTR